MMNAYRKHCSMNLKRVFSSFGVAMNKDPSPTLYYVTSVDALLIVGIISATYYLIAPINDSEARTSNLIKDSEARISNIIKQSEARTNNIINEIKNDMKSEIRESESRMTNKITLLDKTVKSDLKASELRIIQKIDVNSEKKVIP